MVKKKEPQLTAAQQNLQDLQEKAAMLAEAQQRIVEDVEALDTEIATASALEQEQRAESLSKGYPAKRSPRLRELRDERENLLERSWQRSGAGGRP